MDGAVLVPAAADVGPAGSAAATVLEISVAAIAAKEETAETGIDKVSMKALRRVVSVTVGAGDLVPLIRHPIISRKGMI